MSLMCSSATTSEECSSPSSRRRSIVNLLPNGRVKIKMEYIGNKLRRYTTFSKRKTGIMKKAHELSTLTGTQVMLLVASETGHIYAFATNKLKPMISSEQGKNLIQQCLNAPDDRLIDSNNAIKTEFTFDPPSACLVSSNPRKRKYNDNEIISLPTMIQSNSPKTQSKNANFSVQSSSSYNLENFCCGESDDSDETGNEIDDNADKKEELTQSSSFVKLCKDSSPKDEYFECSNKNNSFSFNKSLNEKSNKMKSTKQCSKPNNLMINNPQALLKEALKAAADQRQRQKKLASITTNTKNFDRVNNLSANNTLINNDNLIQQQLSSLIPIMLQAPSLNNTSISSPSSLNSKEQTFNFNSNENVNIQNVSDSESTTLNNLNTNVLQQFLNKNDFSINNFSIIKQMLATAALLQLTENSKN